MMDFEGRDGEDFDGANLIQAEGNAAPPPVARTGPARILTANAQGVVVLPEGVSLDNVEIDGRNLVVVGDDGTRYVIVDGAIVVPQLVVEGVAVPPANLAALLEGLEIAAINTQSSGNNFFVQPGDIQAAYGLGDLLPPTALSFPEGQEREILPDIVDRDPGTVIVTPNNPAGAVMATASVSEAGLPARGSEPPGSNAAATSETTTGTIIYTAPDGLDTISLNGVAITAPGQTVAGAFGTLTVTSVAPGAIGYTYTLADNTLTAADDVFMVTVLELDGDSASATLNISIVDDVPTARNDTDSVPASTFTGESGNVLTGTGTTSGAAGADTPGADGATVTGVFQGTTGTFAAPGAVAGLYGTLTINAQGNYTYTRTPGTPGGVTEVFTYRITDGDGDASTATLTIAIGDAPATVVSVPTTGGGTVVDEEGLPVRGTEPPGSNEPANVEETSGTITFVAPDGVGSVQIDGTTVTGPGQQIDTPQGTLTIDSYDPGTGTLTYTFTLSDNTSGDATQVTLTVTVTDIDGDSDSEPFTITIIDDAPLARADADSVTEDGPTTADGNVITGAGGADANATDGVADTQGADGASVTAVAFGATNGTVGTALAGAYGTLTLNADGSYSYALDNAHPLVQGLGGNDTLSEVFDYTLTDGDGDAGATTLTITINGANDVVGINGLDGAGAEETVYEDDLADGSSPNSAGLTQTGTFTVDSPDGLAALTVNGTPVFGAGVVYPVTFATAYGTMTITGVATTTDAAGDVVSATVSYSYELTDNTLLHTGANGVSLTESFTVVATDSDGSSDTASLDVTVVDDVPTAHSDADSVTEDGATTADGNVITGSGGADVNATDGVADTQGADGATVSAVAFGATAGTVGSALAGAYGSLTLAADGSYTYTLDNAHPLVQGLDGNDTLIEIFNYRLTDGDGDSSSATLTISINGTDDGVVIGGLDVRGAEEVVYEDDLADGSSPDAAALTQAGSFTVDSQDGLVTLTVNGTSVFGAGVVYPVTFATAHGTMSITGVTPTTDANGDVVSAIVNYSYTLIDNTLLHTGGNDGSLTETLTVAATDTDGSTDTAGLDVTIVDDVPTAHADIDSVTEDGPTTADGNVITGAGGADANASDGVTDTQGADGATVTAVSFGATNGTVGTALAGTYGSLTLNADGSYSYALDNAHPLVQGLDGNDTLTETFAYTITDGDGDDSATTLTITINGADDVVAINGLDVAGAEETVYEDDLADGSSPDAAALTQAGTFTVDSPDGLAALTVNGTPVFGVGVVYPVTFATAYGTMSVTGVATTTDAAGDVVSATVSYSYELTDNTLLHTGANDGSLTESFAVVATDTDGSSDTASLDVTIVDDVPIAAADADSVTEDGPTTADGNVISGAGGADANATDGVTDTQGADGATVSAVAFGATNGTVGTALAGAYGSLTLNADGSYSYALDNAHPLVQGLDGNDTLTEIFDYTLTDGDGDDSATTLTITINGADDVVVINGLDGRGSEETLYEDDLADGSSPNAAALIQDGTFTVDSPDGLAALTIDGTPVFGAGVVYPVTFATAYGTMSVTGVATTTDAAGDVVSATVSYSYTLTDNTLLHTGANDGSLTESFAVVATDSDGSNDTASLDVTIVDDVPTAAADADNVTEDGPTTADGNVISGAGGADANATDGVLDTQGADGATVTAVSFGATNGTVGDSLAGTYGSLTLGADGSYVYTLNNAHPLVQGLDGNDTLTEIFDYTITDGDGDASATTLTITINGADDVVVINGLDGAGAEETVDEDDLADGSSPDAAALTQAGTFTVDSPDGLAALTVNGTPVFGVGVVYPVTFATAYGTMSITGVATTTDAAGDVVSATVSYSYELTDNTLLHTGGNDGSLTESFAVVATDTDGSNDTASLDVTIVDDVPAAAADADSVTEDGPTTADGNVITGSGGVDLNASDGVTDTQGADGATVTAVAFLPTGGGSNPGSVGIALAGAYGSLTLDANGSYSYVLSNAHPLVQGLDGNDTLTETFSYTITDGDGDASPTTLTITINGANDIVVLRGLDLQGAEEFVYEDDLADGSSPDAPALTQAGTFTVDSPDGLAALTVNGTPVFGVGVIYPVTFGTAYGTMSITGVATTTDGAGDVVSATVSYSYTLTDNTLLHTGANDGSLTESFAVVATDTDGSTDTGSLDVMVVDDIPTGVDDSETQAAENTPVTIDVFANDVKGADGAVAASVQLVPLSQIGGGTLTNNGDGTFTLQPDPGQVGTVTFQYTFLDGDGDVGQATAVITLLSDSTPRAGVASDLVVDEDGFLNANLDGVPLRLDPAEANSTESLSDLTGQVVIDFGGDVPLAPLAAFEFIDDLALDGQLVTLANEDVVFAIEAGALVGRAGSSLGAEVIRITLDSAVPGPGAGQITYSYSTTLAQPVKHTGQGEGTDVLLNVSFQVSDFDGNPLPAPGTFDVTVYDDVPLASNYTGAAFAEGSGAHTIGDAATLLGIAGGADGLAGPLSGIAFTNLGATTGTLAINGAGELIYTSPASVTSAATVTETFSYTVTDGDGDAVTRQVTFDVSDTGVGPVSAPNATVDEDDIVGANGLASGPGDLAVPAPTGHITYSLGADALQSVALSVAATGLTKLDGVTVVNTVWNGTDTLIGYGGANQADVVFTIVLSNVTNTGADYTVTLLQPVKHPGHDDPTTNPAVETSYEDDLPFTVDVTVKDADNSQATTSFTVTIDDDSPLASNYTGGTFAEGSGAHTIGDAATLLGIAGGADGLSGPLSGIAFTNLGATTGTLAINGAGELIYTSPANVTSAATVTETFSYTVTDGDGDAVTRQVTFDVSDTGVGPVSAPNATVDEDDIVGANGLASGPGDLAVPAPTGHISYSLGADALQSVALSVAATGLTKLDGVTVVNTVWDGVDTLIGYGGANQADVVFRIVLSNVTATGADYTVTLLQPVKHPGHDDPATNPAIETSYEDDLPFTVDVTVKDADNSQATTSFTVTIDDDSPVAQPNTNGVAEGASVSGNVLTDGTADGFGADGPVATVPVGGVIGVRAGNDTTTAAVGSLGGAGIAGLYGTLTLNADGSYTYDGNPNVIAANQQDVFVYTIEDKDGDRSTTTLTINLTAVTLVAVNADVATFEKALDTTISGSDVAAGTAVGSLPADTGETATGNVTVAGATGYTIAGGTVAGPLTTVVGTYGTLVINNTTGTFTYTLTSQVDGDSLLPSQGGNNGANVYDNIETFNYVASDANGNTIGGTITVDVTDDVPSTIVTQNAIVNNVAAATGTFDLDTDGNIDNNVGADQPGKVSFAASLAGASGLTSNNLAVFYHISADGQTLIATTSATDPFLNLANTTAWVFKVDLTQDNSLAGTNDDYVVTMYNKVDSIGNVDFTDGSYDFVGGNTNWVGYTQPGLSNDLLVTPTNNGGSANGNANEIGAGGGGGGMNVGLGEGLRLDFVTELGGIPPGGPGYTPPSTHTYLNHYTVPSASVKFTVGNAANTGIIKFVAYNDDDFGGAGDTGQVGEPATLDDIVKVVITYADGTQFEVDTSTTGTDPVVYNAVNYTVTKNADGTVIYNGIKTGSTVAVFTADGAFTTLETRYEGGDSFAVIGIGSAVITNRPVSIALPIELADADGDVAASYLDITFKPAAGTQQGTILTATAAEPNLLGTDGDDTLTGHTGANWIAGGKGADTLTGGTGGDVFVIDPSHITAAADDTITDYGTGDVIDLRAVFGSMGALAPTTAAQGQAATRLLGNLLQVDADGTGAGTTFVTVATLSNNPASISVLFEYGENAITETAIPPLALDLDGDGVEFVSTAAGVAFDFDGDGSSEATAWVGGDDGILAVDLDGDGRVSGAAEIVFGSDGLTDLEGLAASYDGNGDGVFDAQDAGFASFGVWQDADQDGVSDTGEFRSLGELGITSIGLTSDGESYLAADGDVLVRGEASFVRDGATHALADAAFATAPVDRRTAEVAVATAAAGALLVPELAAANDTGPTIDDGAPLASVSVDTGEAQAATDGPSGHSAPAKLAELLDDAPAHEHGTASSHHADDAAPADSGWEADDSGSHAAAPGAGSEAVADFGDASGALFDFGGGEALMDALLVTAPGDAAGLAAQALAPVREAVAEAAAEAAVDAVVGHFADAGTAVPLGAEPASHVLLEALDAQLVFAGNGGLAPDAIDDAADLAAAAQA